MANIYQTSLDTKFNTILDVIAKELGYGENMMVLTAERRSVVQGMAEQSILNWAIDRKARPSPRVPITNLQHLLDEYCALAEHI